MGNRNVDVAFVRVVKNERGVFDLAYQAASLTGSELKRNFKCGATDLGLEYLSKNGIDVCGTPVAPGTKIRHATSDTILTRKIKLVEGGSVNIVSADWDTYISQCNSCCGD